MPREQVPVEAAYAEALVEIGRLQEQVILCRALIATMRKEVDRGQDTDNAAPARAPHDFHD